VAGAAAYTGLNRKARTRRVNITSTTPVKISIFFRLNRRCMGVRVMEIL